MLHPFPRTAWGWITQIAPPLPTPGSVGGCCGDYNHWVDPHIPSNKKKKQGNHSFNHPNIGLNPTDSPLHPGTPSLDILSHLLARMLSTLSWAQGCGPTRMGYVMVCHPTMCGFKKLERHINHIIPRYTMIYSAHMKSVSIFVVVQVLGKGNIVIEFFALIARLTSEDPQQKPLELQRIQREQENVGLPPNIEVSGRFSHLSLGEVLNLDLQVCIQFLQAGLATSWEVACYVFWCPCKSGTNQVAPCPICHRKSEMQAEYRHCRTKTRRKLKTQITKACPLRISDRQSKPCRSGSHLGQESGELCHVLRA